MQRRLRKDLTFIELPVAQRPTPNAMSSGNCGLYTAILPTPHRLYVPVFGNLPRRWAAGYYTGYGTTLNQDEQSQEGGTNQHPAGDLRPGTLTLLTRLGGDRKRSRSIDRGSGGRETRSGQRNMVGEKARAPS